MIITIILIIILLVSIHHYYLHYGKRGRLINLIPGPPVLPVFGNILHLNVPNEKLLQRLCELYDQYYPLGRIWFYHVPAIGICHPDDMKVILDSSEHIEKSDLYKCIRPWMQTGLITSGGSKWHTRRKILTPTFHSNMLKKFVDVFVEESNRMITILKNVRGPVVKELVPFLSEHMLNIACETTMGISLTNSIESKNYRDAVHKISKIILYRMIRIWLHIDWIFALLPISRKQRKVLNILHSFANKIIIERKQYHEQTDGRYLRNSKDDTSAEVDDTEINRNKKRQFIILDCLIAASQENNMTNSDIQEEVNSFLAAGYDTTTMATSFALMLLAEHTDIQVSCGRDKQHVKNKGCIYKCFQSVSKVSPKC